jgi:hypothetical protein
MSRALQLLDSTIAMLKAELAAGNARFETLSRQIEAETERSVLLSLQVDAERAGRTKAETELAALRVAAEELRQGELARRARGLLARLRAALRGE